VDEGLEAYWAEKEASGYKGTGDKPGSGTGSSNDGQGEVISGPGAIDINDDNAVIFVTDNTTADDAQQLAEDAPDSDIHTDITNWPELADILETYEDGSISILVISGHGDPDGGAATSETATGGGLDGGTLPQEIADLIGAKLAPDAQIIILSCDVADDQYDDGLQEMADKTDHPVLGNDGGVGPGATGDGSWFEYEPQPEAAP
jgi:hypothetical protein